MSIAVGTVVGSCLIAATTVLFWPSDKPKKVVEATEATNPVAPVTIPLEAKIDAMLRGHPNSKKVCVDAERENAFFLDYGPIPKTQEEWANGIFSGGWLFIEKVEFFKTSNNTWFITNQEEKKYVQVYPDVAGLTCKAH